MTAISAREKREAPTITCRCGASWTALGAAHCSGAGCHQTFATVALFDLHRTGTSEHGRCREPQDVTDRLGNRVMFRRDGMWRGPQFDTGANWAHRRSA